MWPARGVGFQLTRLRFLGTRWGRVLIRNHESQGKPVLRLPAKTTEKFLFLGLHVERQSAERLTRNEKVRSSILRSGSNTAFVVLAHSTVTR